LFAYLLFIALLGATGFATPSLMFFELARPSNVPVVVANPDRP